MLNSNSIKNKAAKLFALTLSLTTVVNSFSSASAKPDNFRYRYYEAANKAYTLFKNRSNQYNQSPIMRYPQDYSQIRPSRRNRRNYYSANLPGGTVIPTDYPAAKKILVTKDETAPVTLDVAEDIRDRSGNIVIPRGSQIIGEIRPADGGSRFVGDTLVLPSGDEYFITANSQVVSRTETVSDGKNTDAIWQGAAAGAAAATIIAGVTGDRAIATEEVLGGAGFGALAGFIFGGDDQKELIVINTQEDLDLILTSDLVF